MKDKRSLIPNGGNDRIMTPLWLTDEIVQHFNPYGKSVLEPCSGTGNFVKSLNKLGIIPDWCEIDKGVNFFDYDKHVDWIITNPPYSILTDFLDFSLDISDNVVFLCLANAIYFKKRLRIIHEKKFGIKEMFFVKAPTKDEGWPTFGIPFCAFHILKGYQGSVKLTGNKEF